MSKALLRSEANVLTHEYWLREPLLPEASRSMQASKHFHKFQEKYASAANHKLPCASPVSNSQARSLSPPVHCVKRASQDAAPADGHAASFGQSQHDIPQENAQATPQQTHFLSSQQQKADQDLLTFRDSPKIDWSSGTHTATQHMPSQSCHTQTWDMQDRFAHFAEEENTDLLAQSPECQRDPFADAFDGPSAEDALFDRLQQDSAWLDTEQQQGTFVVVKPRSFPLRHKGWLEQCPFQVYVTCFIKTSPPVSGFLYELARSTVG
ncbi:hypothetical protein WJX79_006119 [Trebouxia sp. C0005]